MHKTRIDGTTLARCLVFHAAMPFFNDVDSWSGSAKALKRLSTTPTPHARRSSMGLEGEKVTLWAMPVSRPYNPNGRENRRVAAGGSCEGGPYCRYHFFRMGRVSQGGPRSQSRGGGSGGLDRGQRRLGQLPDAPSLLCVDRGNNKAAWCNRISTHCWIRPALKLTRQSKRSVCASAADCRR